jgi:hypothetical protein
MRNGKVTSDTFSIVSVHVEIMHRNIYSCTLTCVSGSGRYSVWATKYRRPMSQSQLIASTLTGPHSVWRKFKPIRKTSNKKQNLKKYPCWKTSRIPYELDGAHRLAMRKGTEILATPLNV